MTLPSFSRDSRLTILARKILESPEIRHIEGLVSIEYVSATWLAINGFRADMLGMQRLSCFVWFVDGFFLPLTESRTA
jgi:hypothetical protein